MKSINVADLRDPDDPDGRSYRQINAESVHGIPIGTLVEIVETGVRLFVVAHDRDCDMTPLYYLSHKAEDTRRERPGFRNPSWSGGYPEDSLERIAPMKLDWDGLLRVILEKAYSSQDAGQTDDDDTAVMAVLLSLHAAIGGEHDLTKLASACMHLHEGRT